MNQKNKKLQYTEVWGDTVIIRELFTAVLIGIVLTMSFYLLGEKIFVGNPNIEESLAKGYSLLIGITGCILSGAISAKLFRPKRNIEEKLEQNEVEEILKLAGMTLEEETEALSIVDPAIIKEMEDLELWSFLALIPEGTPNYKPEYRERNGGN
ncbi:hypothetical protein [Proteiniclasticum ruminis]|uniref:Uncharacterized protein n=1 Tax=Proteiniclasticum ruminis TaxID=398199 RepID=A0A1G8K0C6_9CLOT|nr:hypothetical protein [Proteiniclasticum ruminis]SDI36881.1 hypothetical protein SAMN05421804_102161 [Proteiniclasticum ruminis]